MYSLHLDEFSFQYLLWFEVEVGFGFWFIGVTSRLECLPREAKLCQSDRPAKNHITADHKSQITNEKSQVTNKNHTIKKSQGTNKK